MDNPFIFCPFNAAHRVPRSRIQGHIVKCQDNYPDYKACPYNATHRLPQQLLKEHVEICPSREKIFPDPIPPTVCGDLTTPKPMLQRQVIPMTDPNHEIWDD